MYLGKKNTKKQKTHQTACKWCSYLPSVLAPLKQKKNEASSSWLQIEGITQAISSGFAANSSKYGAPSTKKKEGLCWQRTSLCASHGKCSFASVRHNWAWCQSTSFLSTECTYVLLDDDLSLSPETLQSVFLRGPGGSQKHTNIWLYHFTVEIIERLLG